MVLRLEVHTKQPKVHAATRILSKLMNRRTRHIYHCILLHFSLLWAAEFSFVTALHLLATQPRKLSAQVFQVDFERLFVEQRPHQHLASQRGSFVDYVVDYLGFVSTVVGFTNMKHKVQKLIKLKNVFCVFEVQKVQDGFKQFEQSFTVRDEL